MDDPKTTLNNALKEAMKNKDNVRRDVIRMTLSAIKQVEVDSQKELSPQEINAILVKEAKTRRESIEDFKKAGRDEIVEEEQAKLEVLESFMPRQLGYDEIKAIASEIVAQTGATTTKDTGKVMGPLMARLQGQADGKVVNQVVKELLGG
jgi:uncharacterized protein YqeY